MRKYNKSLDYKDKVRHAHIADDAERSELGKPRDNLTWVRYARIAENWLNARRPEKAAQNYRKSADELYAQERGGSVNLDNGRRLETAREYYRKAKRLEKVASGESRLFTGHGRVVAVSAGMFIFLSFMFSASSITGNVIGNMSLLDSKMTGAGLFIIGIVLAMVIFKKR